jgi:alpha-L-fucosidase
LIAGEGPTQLKKSGAFNEDNNLRYTPEDIRFTYRNKTLYATLLAWPSDKALIKSLVPKGDTWPGLYPSEVASIKMLGSDEPLHWEFTKEALAVDVPKKKPCDHAFVYEISLKNPF